MALPRNNVVTILLFLIVFIAGLNIGLHRSFIFSIIEEEISSINHRPINENFTKRLSNKIEHTSKIDKDVLKKEDPSLFISPKEDSQKSVFKEIKRDSNSNVGLVESLQNEIIDKAKHEINKEKNLAERLSLIDSSLQPMLQNMLKKSPSMATSIDFKSSKIPILLLTCNRPELLEKTLDSLLSVRGVDQSMVLLSQDGSMQAVSQIIREKGLNFVQNLNGINLRGGHLDGASRIAMHYKFSLSMAFQKFPEAPAIIITEDDLLFSPDFYEFMVFSSPILARDPSAFVISAWSDNGFKNKVHDPHALRRTNYFPGLGWLLTRTLYKNELEPLWPSEHWDHWLRSDAISKHREIVYPQVPRTYHNGIKGTFMNLETHNKYFRDIGYNQDAMVDWEHADPSLLMTAHTDVYEQRIIEATKQCLHLDRMEDLVEKEGQIICLWIDVPTECEGRPVLFEAVSNFFGLWHEHRRGNHNGLHEFYFAKNYVMLFNVYSQNSGKTYRHLMPSGTRLFHHNEFDKNKLSSSLQLHPTKADRAGMSCVEVCADKGKKCDVSQLQFINSCPLLQKHFPCKQCSPSFGADQPAYVSPDADPKFSPGTCLMNFQPSVSSCEASHHATFRLCMCTD